MSTPIEQDVVLDADGRPLFSALEYVRGEVEKLQVAINKIGRDSYKNVEDVGKVITEQTRQLQIALSQLRTLTGPGSRSGEFESALKARTAESKAYYTQDAAQRTRMDREVVNSRVQAEREGERLIAQANQERMAKEVESAKLLKAARLEAARAGLVDDAKSLTNMRELSAARADNIDKLQRYRLAARQANDPEQQRALATLIELEKARGAALNQTTRALETQQRTATRRLSGLDTRSELLLAPGDVQLSASVTSAQEARVVALQQQIAARQQLINAETIEEKEIAIDLLRIANARVVAANQLVAAEERVRIQQEREQAAANRPGQPSALQNIVSPGYAAAAFARTTIYGGAALAAYGAFNVAQNSVQGVIQMQDELQRLQAISNSTDTQMQTLRTSIFAIGTASRFSVVDLIKISETLAQAGVTAGQMAAVLHSVTTLATASGSTPDEAVQLVTSALGAFNLQATEAGRVADLMTSALNRTKLTVQQTGQAIQYVGATANEQNISLEQLLATIGAVAQAGIRSGSTIGTGFRQFLVGLQEPTEKLTRQLTLLHLTQADVDVSVRGLPAVLNTLREAGFGAAQAYAGLNVRAAAFYLTASQNIDVMDQLQLAFANTGAAQIANDRAMNSLSAQWQRFKNILAEGLSDRMQGTLRFLQNALEGLSDRIERARVQADQLRTNSDNGTAPWYERDFTPQATEAITNLLNRMDEAWGGGHGIQGNTPLGTWLQQLTEDTHAATSASGQFATRVAEATEKVDQQRSRITELDTEMQRLVVQKESLYNNDVRSAAETITLTSRFEGLASQLTNTGNRYDDLMQAARRYRIEQQALLATELLAQRGALAVQTSQAGIEGGRAISNVRQNRDLMQALRPNEQAALAALTAGHGNPPGSQGFLAATAILNDTINRFLGAHPDWARDLANVTAAAGTISNNVAQIHAINPLLLQSRAAADPANSFATDALRNVQAAITQLGGQTNGTRTKTQISREASQQLDALQNEIQRRIAGGVSRGTLQFLQTTLNEIPGLRQQISAANAATPAEERAARAADREASRMPIVTREMMDSIARAALGNVQWHRGSADVRSAASEDAMHAAGITRATGGSSEHVPGVGFANDYILPRGMSEAEGRRIAATVQAAMRNAGITAHVVYETGHGRHQGTAPQVHVGVHHGTRLSRTADPEQAAEQEQARLDQDQLTLDQHALVEKLRDLAHATTQSALDTSITAAKAALDRVNTDVRTSALNDLALHGVAQGTPQYRARMAEIEQQITQNVADFQQKVTDAILASATRQIAAVTRAFERAIQPSASQQAIAEGRVSGLSLASLDGHVPDYTRQLAERRAAAASESASRARYAAMGPQIAGTESVLSGLISQRDSGTLDPDHITQVQVKIDELTNSLNGLRSSREALGATLSAGSLIPHSFTEGLNQAADAYRQLNHTSMSFSETLTMNLGGALEQVTNSLSEMFTAILTGSQSGIAAFANFAKAIIGYVAQIIAKFIALKLVSALLNLIAPGIGVVDASTVPTLPGYTGGTPNASGTAIDPHPRGYLRGGEVTNGSTANDSVVAKIARGEWMVNKSAVDSVGHNFMAQLNQHGSKALDSLRQMPQISVRPLTDLKVYMVKPEAQPQLGPNDILLTWQDDVLSGGESMKLIKHVAREAVQ